MNMVTVTAMDVSPSSAKWVAAVAAALVRVASAAGKVGAVVDASSIQESFDLCS